MDNDKFDSYSPMSRFLSLVANLERSGVDQNTIDKIHENPHYESNLAEYMLRLAPDLEGEVLAAERQGIAKAFLKDRFISLEQMSKAFGFEYGLQQQISLNRNIPDYKKISRILDSGAILFPGPPEDMGFKSIWEVLNEKGEASLLSVLNDNEQAGLKSGRWYAVRLGAWPETSNKTYVRQRNMLDPGHYVPGVAEVILAVALNFVANNKMSATRENVRTSTETKRDHMVEVGRLCEAVSGDKPRMQISDGAICARGMGHVGVAAAVNLS